MRMKIIEISKIGISAFMTALIMIFGLSACSNGSEAPDTAMTIGGTEIGSDVFAYYLDVVLQDSDESLSEDDAIAQAEAMCAEYVKVNTEFKAQNLSLSSSSKAIYVNDVNNLWSIYGGYYESIGVSKETLTKVKESEAYKERIVTAMYGTGGEKAVSEEDQKSYFASNHIFFKAISAYLYTTYASGNVVKLSENELAALKTKFDDMKSGISSENTIDAVNKAYEEANGGSADSEMQVLSTTKTSELYPEGFFDAVAAMKTDETEVLVYDNYYFLVQKKSADTYFSDYSYSNLLEMISDEFTEELDSRYKDLKADGDKGTEKACYKTILKVKSK